MRVAIVAEYYPRAADPALGVWAHRQALAARDAGADVRVLVLHRPVPSRAALASRDPRALLAPLRQPLHAELDGIGVTYVPFVAPPRPRSYGAWGAWAAPSLALTLRALHQRWPYDLVHAHYAAPGGDAVQRALGGAGDRAARRTAGDAGDHAARRTAGDAGNHAARRAFSVGTRGRDGRPVPYVVSVHGGDLLSVAALSPAGARAVRNGLESAVLTLANSTGMARRAQHLGAETTRVVHLGTDLPAAPPLHEPDRIVSVAHLVPRKRHADLLRALWLLRDRHPQTRLTLIGDGPERARLQQLTDTLGLTGRVDFRGALAHADAVREAQTGAIFALPSVDEAFGVAYVEAMAGGVPAIGCRGEDGPEEIHATGEGLLRVPPGDPERLAHVLSALITDDRERRRLGAAARATVARHFTWPACGAATLAAYEEALA